MIYLIVLLSLLLGAAGGYFFRLKNGNSPQRQSAEQVLGSFLRKYGCALQNVSEDKKNHVKSGSFIFQGGYFDVLFKTDGSAELLLIFPEFLSAPTEESERLLLIANDFMAKMKFIKIVLEGDSKKDEVTLSLGYETADITEQALENICSSMYRLADMVREKVNDKSFMACNAEQNYGKMHAAALLSDTLVDGPDNNAIVLEHDNALTVGNLIAELFDKENDDDLKSMTVIVGSTVTKMLDYGPLISSADLWELTVDKMKGSMAVVFVESACFSYSLSVSQVEDEKDAIYARLAATRAPRQPIDDTTFPATPLKAQPNACSLLIAKDKTDDTQHRAEYTYMWLDAQDKMKDGRADELTEEQKLLIGVEHDVARQQLYWGTKYVLRGRYLDAICYLTQVYNNLKPDFFRSEQRTKDVFFTVCYNLGMCYYQLQEYEKAYYYLDISSSGNRYNYVTMFVNLLSRISDIRSFREIEMYANEVNKQFKSDNVDESDIELRNFLMKNHAAAFLNFNDLDAAEAAFKELSNDEDLQDFALQGLEVVKQRKAALTRSKSSSPTS